MFDSDRVTFDPSEGLQSMRCDLETGQLRVHWAGVHPDGAPPFGFAERNNPRRAFLFVSRVLGRHVPVRPSLMRQAFTELADGIPADLPGPVVMTGMAETAVGLGAGVHDAFLARTGRTDVLYLSTTRAALGAAQLTAFREEHSHASAHHVYRPQHAADRALLTAARSLVMVDDEASSGDTFVNLGAALIAAGLDCLERVHTVVLTDWRGRESSGPDIAVQANAGRPDEMPGDAPQRPASGPVAWTRSALLYGHYEWTPHPNAPARALPDADRPRAASVTPLHRENDARLGRSVRSSTACPKVLRETVREALQEHSGIVLVLGTGEHVWEPFLVAEALERDGHEVRFSATTRSPILPGHEVRQGLAFADHEGLGITNYLYNVDPDAFAQIVLCVDTSLTALDPRLLAALRPHVLVGEELHRWSTLAPRVQGIAAATGFDIGLAEPGA